MRSAADSAPGADPDAAPRLPKQARLRCKPEFDRVFQNGRKVVDRHLVAWILPLAHTSGPSRIGLVVSRKVGNAVVRNRTKRLLREAFRHLAPGIPHPVEIVIVPRPAGLPTKATEARSSLRHLLSVYARGPRRKGGSPRTPARPEPPGDGRG